MQFTDAIKGAVVGAFLGALAGFGICVWFLAEDLLFPGDTILFGAALGSAAGILFGERFFDWIKEHWWWLS